VVPPFAIDLVQPNGGSVFRHSFSPERDPGSPSPSARTWVALAAVDIGNGALLQSIADLASDDRRFVRYVDGMTAPVKVTKLDVPLALLGSDPLNHRIAGVRALNAAEVVLYTW
jgi:hypothetical protein